MIQASLAVALASSLLMAATTNIPTNVPPPADFFNQSWQQVSKTTLYKVDCTTVPGSVTMSNGLTVEQQRNAALLTSAVSRLAIKETDIVMAKDKKASAAREKSPSLLPYLSYINNELTYEQAQSYTEQTPKFSVQFVVNTQGLYYHAKSTDPWKLMKSKDMANQVLKSLSSGAISSIVDKTSINFDSWKPSGKTALAVYKGKLTPDGVNSVITDTVGKGFIGGSDQNEARIYIDKATKNWTKIEIVVTVDTGSVAFPLIRTCQVAYGKDVKIAIPAKAKSIDAKIGAEEFIDLIGKVQ